MKVTHIDAFAIKLPLEQNANSEKPNLDIVHYGDYYIARDAWTSIYSQTHETCLIRIETDTGIVGWGEGEVPVSGRAVKTIVEDLCTPNLDKERSI